MLAHRVIPTILSKNGHLVKGEGFKADRICGNALQAARIHAMRSVDELVIFDLDSDKPDYEMVMKLTDKCFTPVSVGGGIRNTNDVKELLKAGADKICLKYNHIETGLIKESSESLGAQCITVVLNTHKGLAYNGFEAKNAAWASEYDGAGEIILQSIERDGTMQGYDLELIESVANSTKVPVIASGGCSGYEDMLKAIKAGASAVAAGALFLFTDATPKGASEYLSNHVEVRV